MNNICEKFQLMLNPENFIVRECRLTTSYPYYDLKGTIAEDRRIFNFFTKKADQEPLNKLLVQRPANFTSPLEALAQIMSNKK